MLAVVVPRFSRAAMGSVAVLLATGIVASIVHLPTLRSLWETNYGKALIAKSLLLACALVLGAVNNLRSRPRLSAAAERRDQALGDGAAGCCAASSLGEAALLAGAVAAAAILTSIAPPSSALARAGKADGKVGPGVVARTFTRGGVRIQLGIEPEPRRHRQRLRAAPPAQRPAGRGRARDGPARHARHGACSSRPTR